MTKRKLLQALSAAAALPFLERLPLLRASGKLTNWAGNIVYSTDRIHRASSVQDACAHVGAQARMRVLGTRHCFNSIADSRDDLLVLEQLQQMECDLQSRTVSVGAGVKYGQLGPYLETKGLALHNLASLPHISVAGACSTATHGSGEKNGNLATAVSEVELITASGDLVKLSRTQNAAEFPAAVVGLGALGVITRLTLEVQPTYQVRQFVYRDLPLSQLQEHFDEIQASGYSVSLFTNWRNKKVSELWIKTRTDQGATFSAPEELFGAVRADKNLHPIAGISAENCTQQMGVPGPWFDRLPHFRMGFTPSAGKELQTEYLVPRSKAIDAIMAVERLQDLVSPHLLISEIRSIAADTFWMSTAYNRPSVAIHFTWKPDWPAVRTLLPVIEKELAPFEPRPHWGKLFHMDARELRTRYEKFDAFLEVARQHDPKGKFRNEFLNWNVFGVAS